MIRSPRLIAIAALCAAAAAGSAGAQQVIGETRAEQCFQTVQAGDPGRPTSLRLCRDALADARLTPRDRAATLVNLGILHRRAGEPEAAIRAYDRALAIAPDMSEAWLNRGAARLAADDAEGAITDFDQALSLEVSRPERAYFNRAMAREALGDAAGAYADYLAAFDAAPGFTPAERALSRFEVASPRDAEG